MQPLVSELLRTHQRTLAYMEAQHQETQMLRNAAMQYEHNRAAEAVVRSSLNGGGVNGGSWILEMANISSMSARTLTIRFNGCAHDYRPELRYSSLQE